MRNLKRALSLALTSVMLLGMMVIGTSAASFPDVDASANTEAIEVLSAVGVLQGYDDGQYHPENPVTRNQMAAIICRLKGLDTNASSMYRPFADVPDWAAASVSACVAEGIITGRDDGLFHGDDTVTATEAASMMLRALGYTRMPVGDAWASAVAQKSSQIGLFDGITVGVNAPMNRNAVAQLSLNTLESTLVDVESEGGTITTPDGVVVDLGSAKYTDRLSADTKYGKINAEKTDSKYTIELGEQTYDGKLVKAQSTSPDDMGRPSIEWTYRGDSIGTYAKEADRVMVINPDDAATIGDVATDKDYFNLKASAMADSVAYTLNGDTKATSETLQAGDVVELFYDDDSKVEAVVVARYALAKIDKVDDDVSSSDAKDGTKYYVTLKTMKDVLIDIVNDDDLAGFVAADYTEDTFIAYAENDANEIVDSHLAKTAEGNISAYKSTKTVTLGGTKYNLAATLATGSITSSTVDFDDTNYIAYMTKDNYVLGIDGTESVKLDDVYYVHSAYYTQSGNGLQKFYAQVVDMDGVEKEIEIEETTFKDTFTGMDTSSPNKFNRVQGLYTFTDKDAAVKGFTATTGDCSGHTNDRDTDTTHWHNANGDQLAVANAEAKANNDKFTAKAYVTNSDYSVASNSGALDTLAAQINSSSKSVTVTSGDFDPGAGTVQNAYINGNTKFILIETNASTPTNAELDIETYTGSARVANGKQAFVIASKDGSSYVANVVIVADASVSSGVVNSDSVLYLTGASSTKVADGYSATAYFMDGTSKDVTIDDAGAEGFYTFSINSKGVYELGVAPSNATIGGTNYDDEAGVIADTTISSIYNSRLVTFAGDAGASQNGKLRDIALSGDLQVVDARSGSNRNNSAYTQKVTSLAKLEAAMEKGTVTATAYVDDGEVLLISVTSMPDARSSTKALNGATAEHTTKAAGTAITAVSAAVDEGSKKVNVTVTGTPANGDVITVTGTVTAASKATVSGPVTLTYNGTKWDASGSITVTAENGSAQAYTVEGPLPKTATPTIDTDLSEATVYYKKDGTASALTVAASGATSATYQWQKKASGDAGFSDIEGATSASYTPVITATGTTQYQCLVYDKTDDNHAISDAATSKTATVAVIEVGNGALTGGLTSGATNEVLTVTHSVTNIANGEAVTLSWYSSESDNTANDSKKPSNVTVTVTEGSKVANDKIIFTLTEDGNNTTAETEIFYGITVHGVEFRFSVTTPAET